MKRYIALTAAVLVLAGCSSSPEVVQPDGTSAPAASANDYASLSCDHFRNIIGDVTKGILTTTEIRDKMKEVNDSASIAPQDVQDAATALLAAATQDDGTAFLTAAGEMDKACSAAGS